MAAARAAAEDRRHGSEPGTPPPTRRRGAPSGAPGAAKKQRTSRNAAHERPLATPCRQNRRTSHAAPGTNAPRAPQASAMDKGRSHQAEEKVSNRAAERSHVRQRDDLWSYIWGRVETPERVPSSSSGDPELPAVEAPKKRRLVGKQPVQETAIVVYRPRLRGKQPPPSPHAMFGMRGHYDVLGVRRDATPAEIHAAYRRRALATHPDKGAKDAREFHLVVAAFEELADETRRAAYDRSLTLFGRRDGMAAADSKTGSPTKDAGTHQDPQVAARKALLRMMVGSQGSWPISLGRMSTETLQRLQMLLRGSKAPAAAAEEELFDAALGRSQTRGGANGISKHRQGYRVTVSWTSLTVRSGFTKSLTQAIDWQIALLWMQGVAQGRVRRHRQQQSSPQAKRAVSAAPEEEAQPLTFEEVLQLAEAEPSMELTFQAVVQLSSQKGKKVTSPIVADLRVALEFRQRLLHVAAQATTARSKMETALREEMRREEKEAAKSKQERKAYEKKLIAAVESEIKGRSKRGAAKSSETIAEISPAPKGKRGSRAIADVVSAAAPAGASCRKRPAAAILDAPAKKDRRLAAQTALPALPPPPKSGGSRRHK